MITIRFPTGVSVQYNDASYAVRNTSGYTDIYDQKDGNWIAQVPTASCIVERRRPCRVYNPVGEPDELLDAMLEALNRRRDKLDVYKLAALKKCVTKFDALRKIWKP